MAISVKNHPAPDGPAVEAWRALLDLIMDERPPRIPSVAQQFDLSPQQLKMIRALAPGVELPMNALAEALHCDASNVTGIVDRLEERALIERRPDPADRRVRRLAITAKGADLRERMLSRLFEPPAAIERLSVDEQRTLHVLLRKALA
jgi:MarR family transcriptional regulator, organic hydroperoxide resistance regulator